MTEETRIKSKIQGSIFRAFFLSIHRAYHGSIELMSKHELALKIFKEIYYVTGNL